MGRGDRKTKKGKIFRGSYGVIRPKKKATEIIVPEKKKTAAKKAKTKTVKKKATTKKKPATKKK